MNKNGHEKDGTQKWSCRYCHHYPTSNTATTPESQNIGISESQLRAKHDLRFIVESKCFELKKGVYMTQAEFVQFCKINPGAGYRGVMEHPEYDKFHGKAGGTIYWSHPDSIKKLKDEGVLI